jgi:AbiV family abortive infection protein
MGSLTADQAAAAMQAARLNALDLMDSAELLYTHKRFSHAASLAILAIEEGGKVPLLQSIFLGFGGDRTRLWKSYRLHRAKTASLNPAIQARVRATFPETPLAAAKEIAQAGPTPSELESNKQRAVYSDCLQVDDAFVCHLPRNIDWRQMAWERLCEAQAIVHGLRDYPPEELEVWLRHAEAARAVGGDLRSMLQALHKELLEKGFVKEGWWNTMLRDIAEEEAEGV